MGQINVNIRMDSEVKRQADELFAELGMNMTTAINVFVKQSISTRSIPFQIARPAEPFYSAVNQERIRKTMENYDPDKLIVKSIEELETMADD